MRAGRTPACFVLLFWFGDHNFQSRILALIRGAYFGDRNKALGGDMSYQQITTDIDEDGIMLLTLNRPEVMNAFTARMMHEMMDAIDNADKDDNVRAIIITGSGERAFCAGASFDELVAIDDLEVGKVGFRPGKYMASTDELHITIKGKGGHAALPHKYNSPLLAAAKLITDLDISFVKEKDRPSVLAIGFIEGLGSTNVIPEQVKLKGTLRAMDEGFRVLAHDKILAISNAIAQAYNLEIEFDIRKGYPCLVNDESLTKKSIAFAKQYLGKGNVIDLPIRMTAEDFAYYSHQVPSCFYRLGTRIEQKGIVHGLHTSRFNIDEQSLKIGMGLMAYLAIKN